MNKKVLVGALSTLALGLFALVGVSSVSAASFGFGIQKTPDEIAAREVTMFENQASLLGLSVEDVKSAWAKGESMKDLMTEKGIKIEDVQAKMEQRRVDEQKARMATLVSKGVITQAQADTRLAFMQSKKAGEKGGRGGRMMGLNGGLGQREGKGAMMGGGFGFGR